jgi:magnesium chelatase family protein
MLVKVFGSAVYGVDAITITIEVDTPGGPIGIFIVGLPDNAVKESSDRVISALLNNGFERPRGRIVINMAPADIKKAGAAYDLPIALGILAATGQIPADKLSEFVIMGELSLDGSIKPIKGALPIAIQTRAEKYKGLIVPKANSREGALVNNLEVYGVETLKEVTDYFCGLGQLNQVKVNTREEFFDAQSHSAM